MIERLRWTGLAGAVLLAAGGFLAGADTGPAPAGRAEALWGTDGWFRLGLLVYVAGLVLLGGAWWRLGRQWMSPAGGDPSTAEGAGGPRPSPAGPGTRWLLVTGALWVVPLLLAPPLGSRDVYSYACQGAVWLDGHDPYTTGAAAGDCDWLAAVPVRWHETPAPYGPLGMLVSGAAVGLARLVASGGSTQLLVAMGGLRVVAVVGALLVAGFLPRLARACGVDPAAACWLGLITPLVAVHLLSAAHHDALIAGLIVAGLAMAATVPHGTVHDRPADGADRGGGGGVPAVWLTGAGVALGLAVAVKVTALAALPFAALLAARRGYRDGGLLLLAAAGGFAGLTVATGLGLGWVEALIDSGSIGQWSSLPTAVGMVTGYVIWPVAPDAFRGTVMATRWLGLGALAVVSAALLLRAWRVAAHDRPGAGALPPAAGQDTTRTLVALCGAVLAAVVVLGPVVYPWYAAVPLAVIAASTQDHRLRRWLAVATLVITALALPSGLGIPVLTRVPGALFMVSLAAWLIWWWLRRRGVRRPGRRVSVP